MNIQQRLTSLPTQERSITEGTVEFIHNQWVFFDEQDEPMVLKEILVQPFEIFINGKWRIYDCFDEGTVYGDHYYTLKQNDLLRIQKPLAYVYQEWLVELSDESIYQFVKNLNDIGFSIYDAIYCHNHLFFEVKHKPICGVNFIMFDNGSQICGVQHHFKRNQKYFDRFEITLNSGKRQLLFNDRSN